MAKPTYTILKNLPQVDAYGQYVYIDPLIYYQETGISTPGASDDLVSTTADIDENVAALSRWPYDQKEECDEPLSEAGCNSVGCSAFNTGQPVCDYGVLKINYLYMDEDSNADDHYNDTITVGVTDSYVFPALKSIGFSYNSPIARDTPYYCQNLDRI